MKSKVGGTTVIMTLLLSCMMISILNEYITCIQGNKINTNFLLDEDHHHNDVFKVVSNTHVVKADNVNNNNNDNDNDSNTKSRKGVLFHGCVFTCKFMQFKPLDTCRTECYNDKNSKNMKVVHSEEGLPPMGGEVKGLRDQIITNPTVEEIEKELQNESKKNIDVINQKKTELSIVVEKEGNVEERVVPEIFDSGVLSILAPIAFTAFFFLLGLYFHFKNKKVKSALSNDLL